MNNVDFPFLRILFLGWLFTLSTYAQTNNTPTARLVEGLDSFSKIKPAESIYIQTNKGIYETEEDVWFKGYVLNAQSFIPSIQSKTLFVQLINDKTQKAVWEEKYEIENGFVDGHLYLQDTLQAGTYTMAAYSSHSFYNNTSEFYAARKLKIVKKIAQKKETIQAVKDSIIDFKMFPEGGNLVSGIQNTMAFKAVNSKGKPVAASGTLVEDNKPLFEFKSTHAGMGRFVFTPNIDKSYHVQLLDTLKTKTYSIPEIKRKGISIRLIENNTDFLMFSISQNTSSLKQNIYLRLQVRGEVYSLANTKLNNQVKIRVPLKGVPQGIAEVTIFNANFEPICERLVYIKQDEQLYIKTILNKSEYQTREKATLKIKVTDNHEQPVVAHLGLSVYDKIYENLQDSKNIVTHYNLTTQLKGNLYNPAYYFDAKNLNRKEALDLLLLTQGWRRYVCNEINLKEQRIPKQVVFEDIKGNVIFPKKHQKNPQDARPALMAFSPEKEGYKELILVDSTKMFTITPKHLKMGRLMYLKLMVPQKSKYIFNINDYAFNAINTVRKTKAINYPIAKNSIKAEVIKPFKYPSDVRMLDEVMVKAKKQKVRRDKYLGKLDSIVRMEVIDYIAKPCGTLNCPFHPYEIGFKIPIEGESYQRYVSTVTLTNGQDEEIRETVIYRVPKITDEYLMSRFNLIRTKGYYQKKEFYQPIYDKETINDPFPDYRNALYWNPSVITNEKGEATIEFFCSDINTKFIGNIEGIGGQGLLGAESFDFVIRK